MRPEKEDSDIPDIPGFLKRDANNESEITKMKAQEKTREEGRRAPPAKAPAKAASKLENGAKRGNGSKAAKPAAKAATAAPGKPAKAKAAAPKATAAPKAAKQPRESKVTLDAFGFRVGSKKSLAAAIYSRKKGATLEEVKEELKSSQLNLLKELEEQGFKVDKEKEPGKGKKPVTRYRLHPKA